MTIFTGGCGGAKACATMRRWILPVAVRGIASVMWICFGRLNSASCSLQYASSSASVAVPLSVTAAATSSPHILCGTPKHTASPTAGCVSSTSSISRGEIFSPPRLIISFSRPDSVR